MTLALGDGLVLLAPGGVFVPGADALVVADAHVGYAPTLRSRGYAVPAANDDELIARVRAMLAACGARTLVVAGDLVHGPASARPLGEARTSPLLAFVRAVAPRELCVVLGNHDRRTADAIAQTGVRVAFETLALGANVVHHGDEPAVVRACRTDAVARGGRVIVGHLHPALVLDDGAGARATVPAFVTARGLVCLPALSPLARGGDVRSSALRTQLGALVDGGEAMGAAVAVAGRVIAAGDVWRTQRRAAVRGRGRVEATNADYEAGVATAGVPSGITRTRLRSRP